MDGKTKPTSATGSSIVDDLFGPKDRAASPSSAGYFSTVFPTPSAVCILLITGLIFDLNCVCVCVFAFQFKLSFLRTFSVEKGRNMHVYNVPALLPSHPYKLQL